MIFDKKEITSILIITLILGFAVSLVRSVEIFLYSLLAIFLVMLINIFAKKIASFYLDSEIEIKLWEIKQYWYKPGGHFKKPFPLGAFLPIITTALSFGHIIWMACLTFDIKPKIYRAAKRHGLYSFSEITESHMGMMAASGILANLVFAVIGYLLGYTLFTELNIFYAAFNMIPISSLDGNKIFFGNIIMWSFLAALTLIGLGFVFLVV